MDGWRDASKSGSREGKRNARKRADRETIVNDGRLKCPLGPEARVARPRLTNDSRNLHSLRSIRCEAFACQFGWKSRAYRVAGHLFVVRSTVNQNGRNKNAPPPPFVQYAESVCRSLPLSPRPSIQPRSLFSLLVSVFLFDKCSKIVDRGIWVGLRSILINVHPHSRRYCTIIRLARFKFGNVEAYCFSSFQLYFSDFSSDEPVVIQKSFEIYLAKVQFYVKISLRENSNLGRLWIFDYSLGTMFKWKYLLLVASIFNNSQIMIYDAATFCTPGGEISFLAR